MESSEFGTGICSRCEIGRCSDPGGTIKDNSLEEPPSPLGGGTEHVFSGKDGNALAELDRSRVSGASLPGEKVGVGTKVVEKFCDRLDPG